MRQTKQQSQEKKEAEPFHRGVYLRGVLDALGVPVKAVSVASGLHPSTVSRFFTGSRELGERQEVQIILAIGRLSARHGFK